MFFNDDFISQVMHILPHLRVERVWWHTKRTQTGWRIYFDDDTILSVQLGPSAYSNNRTLKELLAFLDPTSDYEPEVPYIETATTAEIALMYKNTVIPLHESDVEGDVTVSQVLEILPTLMGRVQEYLNENC